MGRNTVNRTALFLQVTEPGLYPPIVNASLMFAEAGWDVVVLSAPFADAKELVLTPHERIRVEALPERSSYIVSKKDLSIYCFRAIELARRIAPSLIYASDPLGGLAGFLAKKVLNSKMIYHEHDSPPGPRFGKVIRWSRFLATRASDAIVFPNAQRADIAQKSIGYDPAKLSVIWNLPRLNELPAEHSPSGNPANIYYHGNISPSRVPENFFAAASSMSDQLRVSIVGYEAPSAKGYMSYLLDKWGQRLSITYSGSTSRASLLGAASEADIGLNSLPMNSTDFNTIHMLGASVKTFDYMACGLPLLVSDLPGWRDMFVEPGYGLACNPLSIDSIETALRTLVASPELRVEMGRRARTRICEEWNYEVAWSGLIKALSI